MVARLGQVLMAAHSLIGDYAASAGRLPESMDDLGIALPPDGVSAAGIQVKSDIPGDYEIWARVPPLGAGGGLELRMQPDGLVWAA